MIIGRIIGYEGLEGDGRKDGLMSRGSSYSNLRVGGLRKSKEYRKWIPGFVNTYACHKRRAGSFSKYSHMVNELIILG